MRRFAVRLLAMLAITAPSLVMARAPEIVSGEVVVRWASSDISHTLKVTLQGRSLALSRKRRLFETVNVMKLSGSPTREQTVAAARALARRADVEYAHPVYIRRPASRPNDALYPLMWHANLAQLPDAWDLTVGSDQVVVAVVDTGIKRNHPEFGDRVLQGYDFVSDATVADDGDGRDSDPDDPGSLADTSSGQHGTHVAGIIGAIGNNGQGIAGVDWRCKILPVRALGVRDGRAGGSDTDIADAIRWAAGLEVAGVPRNPHPAQIINLSFAGPGAAQVLTDAVRAAMKAGSLVVAAAGNDATDANVYFPSAIPGVLSVAASDPEGRLADYSNYGDTVGILAPGGSLGMTIGGGEPGGVWSLVYDSDSQQLGYHPYEGTSQAAPLVAGTAALMLAVYPNMQPDEIVRVIKETANTTLACVEGCGPGLINAAKAVLQARKLSPNPPPPTRDGQLQYAQKCSTSQQCATGVCRQPRGAEAKRCTQFCSFDADCPKDSFCGTGLCAPTNIGIQSNPEQAPPVIIASGCSMADGETDGETRGQQPATAPLVLVGFLLLAVFRRRAPP
jgi:serine protease